MQDRAADEGPSGEGLSESRIGDQPLAEDIVDTEERYDPKLLRAVTKKYNINSTKSLVKAYNAATDKDERAVLLGWLRKYNERSDIFLNLNTVLEYADLANIVSRPAHDDDVLKNLIHSLCSCINQENFRKPNFAVALYRALKAADPSVYGGVAQLIVVATALLGSLSPEPKLTRKNYAEREATFLALQQTFFLLHEADQTEIEEEEKQKLRKTIAAKERTMKLSCRYYPVSFHFKALRQAVERLKDEDAASRVAQAKQYLVCGLCGFVHVFHFLRNLARGDIDLTALESAYERNQTAIDNLGVAKRPWFDLFRELMAKRLEVSKDETQPRLFGSEFDAAVHSQQKITIEEDLKAIRFGIIQEMRLSARQTTCETVRKEVTTKLLMLATSCEIFGEWFNDADIFTAFLDALHEIHTMSGDNQETAKAFRQMQQSYEGHVGSTLRAWLNGTNVEDKLRIRNQRETYAERNKVFLKIGREVGYVPLTTIRSNITELKDTYKDDNFAEVSAYFDSDSTELRSCLFIRCPPCLRQMSIIM